MLPSPRFCGKSKAILCFFGFPLLKFSEYKAFQSDFKKVNLSLFARGSIMYEFKLTRFSLFNVYLKTFIFRFNKVKNY